MTELGTIHFVDSGEGTYGKSIVAQFMFYYCLKILRLAGLERLSFSEIDRAIKLEKRRRENSRNLSSFYSSDNTTGSDEFEVAFDSKYKYIPLLFVDTSYKGSRTRIINQDQCGDLILKAYSPEQECIHDVGSIFKAAVRRVVILDNASLTRHYLANNRGKRLDDYYILKEAKMLPNIRVVKWFVARGTRESLYPFVESVERCDKMIHVLVKNQAYEDEGWDLLEDSSFSEAVQKSLVVSFPGVELGEVSDLSADIDSEVQGCFASSGQFDDLIGFSRDFKLEDLSEVPASKQTSRFANFWS
ncbi:MAG: hypothetical protein F6K17_05835 [Okeania sp. SIO3C4]|nr:hypothetical protein [Okeania sp. SIO3C4]